MKTLKAFFLIFLIAGIGFGIEVELDLSEGQDALPAALLKAINDAYDMNMKGLKVLEEGDLDAALSYFNEALNIFPEYSDAENNRGVVYYRKGNVGEAERIWNRLAKRDQRYHVVFYNLGLIGLHEGDNDEAIRQFEKALKINKKFVEAQVRIGIAYLKSGQQKNALEYLRKAYKQTPEKPDAWSNLAYGYIQAGDTAKAMSVLEKNTNHLEALKMLGRIEAARGNYSKASFYLSGAVKNGAEPSLLVELASTQLEKGDCKNALATLSSYFTHPIKYSADAWLIAGFAAKECNDIKTSRTYFERGIEQYPQDPILRYNLGQIYFHEKQFKQAETVWEHLADSMQEPSLYYLRALSAKKRKALDEAKRLINKALSLDERAEYHDFLGVMYHLKDDKKAAEKHFRKALKINPKLRSAQLNLALSARKDEDLSVAIRDAENAMESCKGDSCPKLALQLAILYYHQKQLDKAAQTLSTLSDKYKNERIYRHLAIFYKELHKWDEAVSVLETAAKRFVLNEQTEYELAEIYLLAGRYRKAADLFTQLIGKWPENTWRLYYQLGHAYLEQNELVKAETAFRKSLKQKNDNLAARGLLAFVLNRKGDSGTAQKLWKKNLEKDPSNAALWVNVGLSLERDGKYGAALEHYQKAAMLKPKQKEIQLNIGNAHAGMEKYTDAIHAYKLALDSKRRDLAAYNLFILSRKKNDKKNAKKMVSLLNDEYASSIYTQRAIAEMTLWDGDTTRSLVLLEKLSEKDPYDYLLMAEIYAHKGNTKKTRASLSNVPDESQWEKQKKTITAQLAFYSEDFRKALSLWHEIGDTSFATQYNMALAAYKSKQYENAIGMVEPLVRSAMGGDHADVCRLVGNAAFALKKWRKAKTWYLQLSGVDAKNAVVQYNLAVASYNLGEIEDAWQYYKRAQALDASISNSDIEKRYAVSHGQSDSNNNAVKFTISDSLYNAAV
jgi:tetratricopeptide (TPR) repeat protein